MPEPLVYLSGKMLPASQAHVAIFDAGVVLGATVTEMTRTFRQSPFKLREHLERLYRSLKYTRMEVGLSVDQFEAVSRELVEHNARLLPEGGELGMVHFVTAGELPVYAGMAGRPANMTPTVCAHTFPMPWQLWAKKYRTGSHLVTPSTRHVPPECYDPKMKYRSRMHYYLADKEAQLVDPDAAALLLDLQGNVTETSGANFLIVERGTIVSPTTRNILPGISRAMVIELAAKLGIPFAERDLQVYNVLNADEAFTSTTPYCILPVTKVNGVPIATGRPGPIYRRLLAAWSEHVGVDIERQMLDGAAEPRDVGSR
jgi:branched-subunit amino acid aminotransferase/4-amino-4-deoxychorismate lyase